MKIGDYLSTDLALEERERFEGNVEIPGVVLEKKYVKPIMLHITKMDIVDEVGEESMGKPIGTYITMEADLIKDAFQEDINAKHPDDILIKHLVKEVEQISKVIKEKRRTLLVGLGNINATPDALGPRTVEKIIPTENIMCIAPGVLAQTGMETYKIIKGIVDQERPDRVIVIDSLAARNTRRVGSTIQITNTGIIPGSGVGNHRMGLNQETLGVEVIAIGIPMVVNSFTIVHDAMMEMVSTFGEDYANNVEDEIMAFAKNNTAIENMYVTPKDVDEMIERLSGILATSLNGFEFH